MNKSRRYYAFTPRHGRRRANDEQSTSEATAIQWAKDIGATNLVIEEGPPSKPTKVTVVWERVPKTLRDVMVWDKNGVPWLVDKTVLRPVRIEQR